MGKIKYGFVVLNYKNYAESIECVKSILGIPRDDFLIVVVDNDSGNESVQVISSFFKEESRVVVLQSGKNGGYSFGNNVGINWLRGQGVEFVIIATSDTILLDATVLDTLDFFQDEGVGIIGPSIVTPDGFPENPARPRTGVFYALNLFFPRSMALCRWVLERVFIAVLAMYRKKICEERVGKINKKLEVYSVCGSFLVMTRNYLDKFGGFDDQIFMYGEEDLLAWNCYVHDLKIVYVPEIKVMHKHKASVKAEVGDGAANQFFLTNSYQSRKYIRAVIGKKNIFKLMFAK